MLNGQEAAAVEVLAMKATWRALAIRWELTWSERRTLLPAGGESLPDSPLDTEHRIRILIEIGYRLRIEDPELCDWLRRPADVWNWYSPLEVMSGTISDLRRFRAAVEQGLDA